MFASSNWTNAYGELESLVGSLDKMLTVDGRDAFRSWVSTVVTLRGDVIHGRKHVVGLEVPQEAVDYAAMMFQQLAKRVTEGGPDRRRRRRGSTAGPPGRTPAAQPFVQGRSHTGQAQYRSGRRASAGRGRGATVAELRSSTVSSCTSSLEAHTSRPRAAWSPCSANGPLRLTEATAVTMAGLAWS